MKYALKAALVAFALVGGSSLIAPSPATAADVVVSTNPGIAYGYSDGYWNRDHKWNAWSNEQQATQYKTQNASHYYDWKHDRDSDMGWRSNDTWWNDHK